jgi:DNA-binding CsgD family transcriptional regulator
MILWLFKKSWRGTLMILSEHIDINNREDLLNLSNIMSSFSGFFAWKNIDYQYLCGNQLAAQVSGAGSVEAFVDAEFRDEDFNGQTVEMASVFHREDQNVIDNKRGIKYLTYSSYGNGHWCTWIGEKVPVFDNQDSDKVIAVALNFIDISDTPFAINNFNRNYLSRPELKHKKQISFEISKRDSFGLSLTERQEACLFYVIRGFSAKQIAEKLSLSKRTVEGHIENLKVAVGVKSKSELTEKMMSFGFLNVLPECLLSGSGSIA